MDMGTGAFRQARNSASAEINKRHEMFYAERHANTLRRIQDPVLYRAACDEMISESKIRPLYERAPLEFHLERAEQRRRFFMGSNGKKGGKRKDALQVLIERHVVKNPAVDQTGLLHFIRRQAGNGTIQDVSDDTIIFVNSAYQLRDAKVSGLKDRLSRAKRDLFAANQ